MAEFATPQLDALKEKLPEPAKDVRINLGNVLGSETLTRDQVWGVALASTYYLRNPALRDAVLADGRAAGISDAVIEDAQAAAALMGMNTIYYRFRHLVGKPAYAQRPARLRMQWMSRPKTNKTDYEVFCLAIAALEGCEACIKAHEDAVLKGGLSEEHVNDIVRIASVINGFAVGMKLV
jgi:lipoyl-dependent peroxiredoxin subunit D